MAEQIPDAWIGQEVTVYYGVGEPKSQEGILTAVSGSGAVVASPGTEGTHEEVFWYPTSSIVRIRHGAGPGGEPARSSMTVLSDGSEGF